MGGDLNAKGPEPNACVTRLELITVVHTNVAIAWAKMVALGLERSD